MPIFSNPIALLAYALVVAGALAFTLWRCWKHPFTGNLGRILLSFFVTLLTMVLTVALMGLCFFAVFFRLFVASSPNGHSMGSAMLIVLLGPAICLVFSAVCSLALGFYISGLFWKNQRPAGEQAEDGAQKVFDR